MPTVGVKGSLYVGFPMQNTHTHTHTQEEKKTDDKQHQDKNNDIIVIWVSEWVIFV